MKKRILILDDDADVLCVVQEIIDYAGFEPIIATGTDDIIGLVGDSRPDLIILDYSLNGAHGGDLCAQLKSSPEFAHIPVIIFTAHSYKGIEKGSFDCDDFINKPFDMDDLTTRVRRLTAYDAIA